jgi:poly-gamma-glutamate synthesis protein (capsule biosynthesis protein)
MKLGFWGDISFGLGVQPLAEKYGYDYFFSQVKALLSDTDINIANFDCTITDSEEKNTFKDGSHLKTRPEAARAMRDAKIALVVLANNHKGTGV